MSFAEEIFMWCSSFMFFHYLSDLELACKLASLTLTPEKAQCKLCCYNYICLLYSVLPAVMSENKQAVSKLVTHIQQSGEDYHLIPPTEHG